MSRKLQRMCSKAKQILRNNNGQGLVEYALILVLVAIVVIASLRSMGTEIDEKFSAISEHIEEGK